MKFQTKILLAVLMASVPLTTASTQSPTAEALAEPVVTKAAAPSQYPAIAVQAHASGKVVIEVAVDAAGHVISAHAVSGHPLLQSAAVGAARRWEFAPASERVKPALVRITFDFKVVAKTKEVDIYFQAPYEFHYAVFPYQTIETSNSSQ